MRGPTSRRVVLALVAAIAVGASPAVAQDEAANHEYELKAACLYNFGLFVQYPPAVLGPKDTFIIGVLGKDPFGAALNRVAMIKTIDGRPIAIRHFKAVDDYTKCHILFIATDSAAVEGEVEEKKETSEERLAALLGKIKDAPVLVVTEAPGLAKRGAIVNFYLEDNKLRFEINKNAAKKHSLQLSSRLLNLSKIVSEDKE
jgi:hypothetical protein